MCWHGCWTDREFLTNCRYISSQRLCHSSNVQVSRARSFADTIDHVIVQTCCSCEWSIDIQCWGIRYLSRSFRSFRSPIHHDVHRVPPIVNVNGSSSAHPDPVRMYKRSSKHAYAFIGNTMTGRICLACTWNRNGINNEVRWRNVFNSISCNWIVNQKMNSCVVDGNANAMTNEKNRQSFMEQSWFTTIYHKCGTFESIAIDCTCEMDGDSPSHTARATCLFRCCTREIQQSHSSRSIHRNPTYGW
jgi:hypothetical protein